MVSPGLAPVSMFSHVFFLPRMVSRLVPSFFLDFTEIERNHGCFFKWENPYSNGWELPPLKWKPPRGLTLIILLKKKQGYNRRRIRAYSPLLKGVIFESPMLRMDKKQSQVWRCQIAKMIDELDEFEFATSRLVIDVLEWKVIFMVFVQGDWW